MPKDTDMSTWERHGQTVIAALILAAIVWVGKNVTELTGTMSVVLNRLDVMEKSIAATDHRFERYQTIQNAQAAAENTRLRVQMLDARIDSLRARLKEIRQ